MKATPHVDRQRNLWEPVQTQHAGHNCIELHALYECAGVYNHTHMDIYVHTFQRCLALHGKDAGAVDQHIHAFVSVQKGFGHLINAFGALHIARNNINLWCTSLFASLCSLQQAEQVRMPLLDPFGNSQLQLVVCHLCFALLQQT